VKLLTYEARKLEHSRKNVIVDYYSEMYKKIEGPVPK
jgi:hypothetical protein